MVSPFGYQSQQNSPPQYPQPPVELRNDLCLKPADDIEALMGNAPSWIMRSGIGLLGIMIAGFFAMCWLIRYPDILPTKVVLTTTHPPIRILAPISGRIQQFFVKNEEKVDSGRVLAILENAARWQDVLLLEQLLDTMQKNTPLSNSLPDTLKLGALQTSYTRFSQNARDFRYFQGQNGVAAKIGNLQEQISNLRNLRKSLARQQETLAREVEISRKELKRQQQLYTGGYLSASELEKFATNVLQMTRQLEGLQTTILGNDTQEKQLEGQILEARQNRNDNTNAKSLTVSADIERLIAEIQEWKRQYVVVAPITGNVAMLRVWSPQQSINVGEEVLTLVPNEGNLSKDNVNTPQNEGNAPQTPPSVKSAILGRCLLPVANAGKVKVGQDVEIRLDGFNYQEFGTLKGKVFNISAVPQQENYLLEVQLDSKQMTTSYGKTLPFRQEMSGTANIITENRRILSRIFDKVISLFKNKT
jgi:multidrug resistance efflux pump